MVWILCIFIFLLSSCEQKPQEIHYKEIAVESPQPDNPHAGLDMSSMALPMGMKASQDNMVTWTTPEGWKQETGAGMRLATFHLKSNPKDIDCSIVSLGGIAGGLEANLRRWMGQIGVGASAEELSRLIASAPSVSIQSGQEGKVFDFTTIQSKAKSTDKSMVVVMVITGEGTLFIKMTGALDSVSRNKEDFFKLVKSTGYHLPSDPHAGLDMSSMGDLISQPTSQNLISWISPEGWKEDPGKHMRMATFHPLDNPQSIDCSIIALGGPAGGLEANLNRWMGQLGLPASEDQLKQLLMSVQNVTTKGGFEAKVFDFTVLQLQGNPSDKSMLAAMITVNQVTVFIKMTGTIEEIKKNRTAFLQLLQSIQRK